MAVTFWYLSCTLAVTAAAARGLAAAPSSCEVCHVRNAQTRAVSAPIPGLPGACSKYAEGSCCTPETSAAIANNSFFSADADYRWDRCYEVVPELRDDVAASAALQASYAKCEEWFHQEHCLYECDVNVGKFRDQEECPDDSQWWTLQTSKVSSMPIDAAECAQWYKDCKDIHFCLCTSALECGTKLNQFFGLALSECSNATCFRTLGQLFPSGQAMCNTLYGSSYMATNIKDDTEAYSIAWGTALMSDAPGRDPGGSATANPNNAILTDVPFPSLCTREIQLGIAQEICTDPTFDPRLVPNYVETIRAR